MHCSRLQNEATKSLHRAARASQHRCQSRLSRPAHPIARQSQAQLSTSADAIEHTSDSNQSQFRPWQDIQHRVYKSFRSNNEETLLASVETDPTLQELETAQLQNVDHLEEHRILESAQQIPDIARVRNLAAKDLPYRTGKPFASLQEAVGAVIKSLDSKALPSDVLFTFLRATKHSGFLRALPDALLKAIFKVIRPEVLLLPFRTLHQDINPFFIKNYESLELQQVFAAYRSAAELILDAHAGSLRFVQPWRLVALLDIARVTGDGKSARRIFSILKQQKHRSPITLEAYNHFLETICWGGAFESTERQNLRVTPLHLQFRSTERSAPRPGGWEGYRTGQGGLKEEVLGVIQEMQRSGLDGDANTYTALLLAMAREGDLDGVKDVIKRVWHVDVGAVLQGDDKAYNWRQPLPLTSPRRPTEKTLFALVHAFSINNDISAAVQVVDFFSRKYRLPVSQTIGTELLQWAFVHSTPRFGAKERVMDARIGQISKDSPLKLWDILSSPPYSLELSMPVLHRLIKTSLRLSHYNNQIIGLMQVGAKFHAESLRSRNQCREALIKGEQVNPMKIELAETQHLRDFSRMSLYWRLLLSTSLRNRNRSRILFIPWQRHWLHRQIPDLVKQFWAFRHFAGNAYDTVNGRIQFHPETARVRCEPLRSSLPGVVACRLVAESLGRPQVGTTRQRRLQRRHSRREQVTGPAPRWQPQWHEQDSIKTMT